MEEINYNTFKAELTYKRILLGYSKKELAEKIGMKPKTFYHKYINPQLFTFPELIHLKQALDIEKLYKEENNGKH
jgi:DNA-binding XRE family transcriptional regulator